VVNIRFGVEKSNEWSRDPPPPFQQFTQIREWIKYPAANQRILVLYRVFDLESTVATISHRNC